MRSSVTPSAGMRIATAARMISGSAVIFMVALIAAPLGIGKGRPWYCPRSHATVEMLSIDSISTVSESGRESPGVGHASAEGRTLVRELVLGDLDDEGVMTSAGAKPTPSRWQRPAPPVRSRAARSARPLRWYQV